MKPMKRICILLLMLPAVARCLRIAPEEDTAQTENQDDNVKVQDEYQREKRSGNTNSDPRQNCDTWSPWINSHHPNNVSDPEDRENVSQQEMDAFCPPQHGGHVSKLSCTDEKGEPFFGNKTSPDGAHFVSCYSPFVGVECVLLKQPCPDMSMKYFCSCTNETSVTSSPGISTTTNHQYTAFNHELPEETAEKPNMYRTDGFNAGRLFVPWWVLYLLIALLVSCISICTVVCMYTHLQKKLRDGKRRTSVHPTA